MERRELEKLIIEWRKLSPASYVSMDERFRIQCVTNRTYGRHWRLKDKLKEPATAACKSLKHAQYVAQRRLVKEALRKTEKPIEVRWKESNEKED